jgi:hypothetical protein
MSVEEVGSSTACAEHERDGSNHKSIESPFSEIRKEQKDVRLKENPQPRSLVTSVDNSPVEEGRRPS